MALISHQSPSTLNTAVLIIYEKVTKRSRAPSFFPRLKIICGLHSKPRGEDQNTIVPSTMNGEKTNCPATCTAYLWAARRYWERELAIFKDCSTTEYVFQVGGWVILCQLEELRDTPRLSTRLIYFALAAKTGI
ncbi:hypothetical protein V496_06314 [Pseudogymnoascus sp. VKM F-4515 (FW-2607)]|nr:hypothetical protein V496_06314 [Pseudogymnoascus sp. VKM F-4515 (FW-2607)]